MCTCQILSTSIDFKGIYVASFLHVTSYLGAPDEDMYDVPSDESGGGLGTSLFLPIILFDL